MSFKTPNTRDLKRENSEKQALKAKEKVTQVTGALSEGKLPTTEQITSVIGSIQDSDSIHDTARGMSPLGKKVLADTEKFLDTTKTLFEEKNAGDELQNLIHYSGQASRDIAETTHIPGELTHKFETHAENSKSMTKDAWQKVLTIPQLLISSSEFRKLVNDIHEIIQEAIASTAPVEEPESLESGEEREKSPKEAAHQTAAQVRGTSYPIAKAAVTAVEPKLRQFSEGHKSYSEAASEGIKTITTNVKDKVTSYHIPPEKRERLTNRFKTIMIQVQKKQEYQDALSEIICIISQLTDYTQEVATRVTETAAEGAARQEDSLSIAQRNARDLLENFANNYSLDKLICLLKEMGNKIKHDEDLHNYLKELQNFVLSSLRDTEFIKKDDYSEHGSRLIHEGRHTLLDKYKDITDEISTEVKNFNGALQEDRTVNQWRQDFETLVQDMFLDEKGRPTIKFELIKDFAKILPVIAEKMKFIPLPRIENSDEEYDYIFDNIVLHVEEIIPKHIHISLNSDINLDREGEDSVRNTVLIEISKLRADARNIAFYYKKKGGLITMKDVGFVDFSIPSDGLTTRTKLLLALPNSSDPNIQFKVLESTTTIKEVKIRLHETKHDFLYVFLTPLVEKRLKRQLEDIISDYIRKSVVYLQENIANIRQKFSDMQSRMDIDYEASPKEQEKLRERQVWESRAFDVKREE